MPADDRTQDPDDCGLSSAARHTRCWSPAGKARNEDDHHNPSCSRWTKPGVCVRLTRMTVSESAAEVGLPQKRKSGDVNDDPVLAARDGRTSGQKPESQIEPGA